MSTIIEVVGGQTAENAAAEAGANSRQQAEVRKFALHTKAVCGAERVILQFIVTNVGKLQMFSAYYSGQQMTLRTITTWLPSGTLLDVCVT